MIKVNKNQRHKDAQEILDRITQSGGGTLWTPQRSNINHYYIQPNDIEKTMMDLTGYTGFNIDNKGIINKTPISVMDVGLSNVQPTKSIQKLKEPLAKKDNQSIKTYKSKKLQSISNIPEYTRESTRTSIKSNLKDESLSSRIGARFYINDNDNDNDEPDKRSINSEILEKISTKSKSKSKSINDIISDMTFEIFNDKILNYNFIDNDDIKKQQKEINHYTIGYYENMEKNNILEVIML
jgi:hypothetical protein